MGNPRLRGPLVNPGSCASYSVSFCCFEFDLLSLWTGNEMKYFYDEDNLFISTSYGIGLT